MTEPALRTMYFLFGALVGAFFGTLAMAHADGWYAWMYGGIAIVGMTFAARPWEDPDV